MTGITFNPLTEVLLTSHLLVFVELLFTVDVCTAGLLLVAVVPVELSLTEEEPPPEASQLEGLGVFAFLAAASHPACALSGLAYVTHPDFTVVAIGLFIM